MNFSTLTSHQVTNDLSAIKLLAERSFGHSVAQHPFVQMHLPVIVEQLVAQSQVSGRVTIKAVHTILAQHGMNTKGMRKHEDMRMFVEAAFLEVVRRNRIHEADELPEMDMNEFLQRYPSFSGLDATEQKRLLRYREYMAVAVRYIHPEQNRDYLLDLVTRMAEGCGVRYVPGSGATLATRNRIDIYRKEGCVRKKPRQPRRGEASKEVSIESTSEQADLGSLSDAALSLKRCHSLDEGGYLFLPNKRELFDDSRVWPAMRSDQPTMELFDLLDTMEFVSGAGTQGTTCNDGMSPDELDALLLEGRYADAPSDFLAAHKLSDSWSL